MGHNSTPITPVMTASVLRQACSAQARTLFDVGRPILPDRGSSAILLALCHAGVTAADEVLLPAFHCPSMAQPVHLLGAAPVFYAIHPTLELDIDSIAAKLSPRTRAVLAPHLFGQIGDLTPVRALCDRRGIVLIEDCAHSFFAAPAGPRLGTMGHYAIGSPRKFFPLAEGGLLTSASRDLSGVPCEQPALGSCLKRAWDVLDLALAHGRFSALVPLAVLARRMAARPVPSVEEEPAQGGTKDIGDVKPSSAPHVQASCGLTAFLARKLSTQEVMRVRNRNFQYLYNRLSALPKVKPLTLDMSRVPAPYMFPLLLSDPERQFAALKRAGLRFWRWEYSAPGVCAVTDLYARALIQLPCHQGLRGRELDRAIELIRTTA